jgi:hypothetical protein
VEFGAVNAGEATVGWSYALLNTAEQALQRRPAAIPRRLGSPSPDSTGRPDDR